MQSCDISPLAMNNYALHVVDCFAQFRLNLQSLLPYLELHEAHGPAAVEGAHVRTHNVVCADYESLRFLALTPFLPCFAIQYFVGHGSLFSFSNSR
jgi:hypothetical protein